MGATRKFYGIPPTSCTIREGEEQEQEQEDAFTECERKEHRKIAASRTIRLCNLFLYDRSNILSRSSIPFDHCVAIETKSSSPHGTLKKQEKTN